MKKSAKSNRGPDKIFIQGLEVLANVGILPHEKISPQKIILDIIFAADAKKAAITDMIEQTTDYAVVCQTITHYLSQHRFHLIETLADRLVEFLLKQFHLNWVQLSVTKPTAIANAKGVGIIIERDF